MGTTNAFLGNWTRTEEWSSFCFLTFMGGGTKNPPSRKRSFLAEFLGRGGYGLLSFWEFTDVSIKSSFLCVSNIFHWKAEIFDLRLFWLFGREIVHGREERSANRKKTAFLGISRHSLLVCISQICEKYYIRYAKNMIFRIAYSKLKCNLTRKIFACYFRKVL